MALDITLRTATPADELALLALERLCPEEGRLHVRFAPRRGTPGPGARYPGAVNFVAMAPAAGTIAGVLSSSVAPTQVNGRVVPAAYLFGLRVHPAHRRRGIASRLIAHALDCARAEAGARVAWAAAIEGNEASLATFHGAGFAHLRDLRARSFWIRQGRRDRRIRAARPADLLALAAALNEIYSRHNFWRPVTPASLADLLLLPGHTWADTAVATADGRPLAAANALHLSRLMDVRLVGLGGLPRALNRALAPLLGALALRPVLLRFPLMPPEHLEASRQLLGVLVGCSPTAPWPALATADPSDAIWRTLDGLRGIDGRVHLVARSDKAIDHTMPACLL